MRSLIFNCICLLPLGAKDRDLGYACQSGYEAIGLMKEGEVKKNYEDDTCGEATCSDGYIEYTRWEN